MLRRGKLLLALCLIIVHGCMCEKHNDQHPASFLAGPERNAALRNSYQTVWDKFGGQTDAERDAFLTESFPAGFQWATSTESFKVEGGWSEGGKGETIWDTFGHAGLVTGNQTADQACDSYHKTDYDLYLLRGLNVNTYQFSISWARIFPSGLRSSQSEKGVQYYDNLINALIESGIDPVVTLYHWDLPQALQNNGGWTNPTIVDAFKDYADFCFSKFGDRVKTWNTFGSPWVVSHAGYGTGDYAPGVKDQVVASYQVTHNIIKSHAEAWHVYNDNYRTTQGGKVGIALNSEWAEPNDPTNAQDVTAADRYLQFMLGWFAHPIFVDGDYPAALKTQIENKKADCATSVPAVLPQFTSEESQRIRGTADFFGLNHYTSRLVRNSNGACNSGPEGVGDFQAELDPTWPTTASPWISSAPWGLRRLLNYISTEYLNTTAVPIYITGNGMASEDILNDTSRIDYMRNYINEALKAVVSDGVNVERFTVQSLMDGFEGPQGYSERFGLHRTNFDQSDRPRTPRQSAYVFADIIANNGFGTNPVSFTVPEVKNIQPKRLPALPASTVPSQAIDVFNTFSRQTQFERNVYHYGTFPEGFLWGVSSSAYQIEGAFNTDGKGQSVWDVFTHTPGHGIPEDGNGDVACDSYNRLDEDLYMLRALQVTSYKFSLSWSRIFPDGQRASLNQKGVDYYNRLIDGLIKYNITPMVTLYHWDLPQALQDLGGWADEQMINLFNDYSDFCFETFGDRVKFWMTFNEPHTIAWSGYGTGHIPPRVTDPGTAPYEVARILLKAHATVYHTYDDKYRPTQGGRISIVLNSDWIEPIDINDSRHVEAADRALQFQLGWFAHPIFKNGDYPEAMKEQISNKNRILAISEPRLPPLTETEKSFIRGTADMFCLNHNTTMMATYEASELTPSYYFDQELKLTEETTTPGTEIYLRRAVPWGLRRILNWIKEEYGNPDTYVTQNGVAIGPYNVDDTDRVFFYKSYVDEALKAQNLDGVNLKGYTASNLMDSFEYYYGYIFDFGLHHVDFVDPNRPRTPKRSAHYYHQIIKGNGFPFTDETDVLYQNFPAHFNWSSASAAFQIEGAWLADGKGLSIWDRFSHTAGEVDGSDNGDIACNSYYKIDEDVEVLKQLKVTHYRFSVSWPRVLPDGTVDNINEAGIDYYQRLLDALLAANIQPQLTLYHWDLPLALQLVGGWENVTIVDRFREYADFLFSRLGDRVKIWITLNEPYIVAGLGYGYGDFAPGIRTKHYIAAHNLIKAHAEAWHLYNDKYRATQGGIISITLNSDFAYPRNPYKQDDVDAASDYMQFFLGWFAHPIFVGDYPEIMKTQILKRSLAQGLTESRLPEFTPEEIQRINGTHDFFGLNHYTSVLAFHATYNVDDMSYDADRGTAVISDRTWLETGSSWLRIAPFGFRKLLNFIKEEYGNPPIYVTENGVSEAGTVDLNDPHRAYYYENYINQGLKAVVRDGVDLRGYTAWSLMDNFEWARGYAERFGLFYVNRSDPNLPRIPKTSASRYATIVNCNGFPDPADGPHECSILDEVTTPPPVTATTTTTTTTTTPPTPTITATAPATAPADPETDPTQSVMPVDFLGLALTPEDAETGLYVTFAFLLVGALAFILVVYMLFKTRKLLKKAVAESRKLNSQF